jgi:hypothetical protein
MSIVLSLVLALMGSGMSDCSETWPTQTGSPLDVATVTVSIKAAGAEVRPVSDSPVQGGVIGDLYVGQDLDFYLASHALASGNSEVSRLMPWIDLLPIGEAAAGSRAHADERVGPAQVRAKRDACS